MSYFSRFFQLVWGQSGGYEALDSDSDSNSDSNGQSSALGGGRVARRAALRTSRVGGPSVFDSPFPVPEMVTYDHLALWCCSSYSRAEMKDRHDFTYIGVGNTEVFYKLFSTPSHPASTMVIVFCGTEPEVSDLAANVLIAPHNHRYIDHPEDWDGPPTPAAPTDDSRILVHTGYFHLYERVRRNITDALRKHSGTVRNVVVTGHSLGGAMASICAPDLFQSNILGNGDSLYVKCVTFAQPRAGGLRFKDVHDQLGNTERFVFESDWAPLLPPFPLFRHVGKLHWLDRNGNEINSVFASVKNRLKSLLFLRRYPHSSERAYLPAVQASERFSGKRVGPPRGLAPPSSPPTI